MANQLSIRVSRRLQKVTPSCSIVKLSLNQRYEFENVSDLFTCLDHLRSEQKEGKLRIEIVRVNSLCLIWSIGTNLPLGWSYLDYIKWQNTLLREYLNEK